MAAEFTKAEEVVKIANPADLIEFDRGPYKHWAIYIGGGDIVNFGSDSVGSLAFQKKSLVKYEKLTDVANSDLCRVNNRLDGKYTPRKTYLVLRDALLMVGHEVKYSVVSWNCEHFVTWLRYNNPESGQVENAAKTVLEVGAASAIAALGAALAALLKGKEEESDKMEEEQEQQKV